MDVVMFFLIVALALGIGFIASMFGIGGGFLLNPAMVLILGMTVGNTVGTISCVILVMSLSSTIAYSRQKRIDFVLTIIVVSTSVLGSVLGALTTLLLTGQFILVVFGIVEIILAIILATKRNPQELRSLAGASEIPFETTQNTLSRHVLLRVHVDAEGNRFTYSSNLLWALPLSFVAGFLSSMLGIGGGTLYIQIYTFLCGMSIHMAIACSMFSIFLTSISGFITFAAVGQVDYMVALAFGLGCIVGAQFGARVNKKIHSRYLKPMAVIMIMVIAINMIFFALVNNPT
nr:sulfite exporter TauE/SafE family protein [Candidatus Sigynarchaeota archaeon]